jgi:hypothetical protein
MLSKRYRQALILLGVASLLAGCAGPSGAPSPAEPTTPSPVSTFVSTTTPEPLSPASFLAGYSFPESIDATKRYLFYLHGKIIEDQGIPAISPEYGEYEYQAILEKLSRGGLVVISEQRAKDTDAVAYAQRVTGQVTTLLEAGVPARNITVVGASKGAWITVYVSHLLENRQVNFVLLSVCLADAVAVFEQDQISLYGNVLSIYDFADRDYAGSCKELFSFSEAKGGLSQHDEIVLNVGSGHGILYHPLDEWILPTLQWAEKR